MAQQIVDAVAGSAGGVALYASTITNARTGGVILDLHQGVNYFNAWLDVGAFNGTSLSVKMQESSDQSTWTDITGGAFSAVTGSNQSMSVKGLRTQRYVQASIVTANVTAAFANVRVIDQAKYTAGTAQGGQGGYSRSPSS